MKFTINNIHGVFPAMVTPVDESGRIDKSAVRALVEYFIGAGVNGLYILGTSGESPLLTFEQKECMIETTLEAVGDRIPVMVHTGTIPLSECIRLADRAQNMGVQFLSAIPPYYFPFKEEDILLYYRTLISAVGEKNYLFLYNIPAFARNVIPPSVLEALCEDPRFAGIKDSAGDISLTKQYIKRLQASRRVFIGSDGWIDRAYSLGASGSISGNANVLPELFVSLYEALQSGNRQRAESLQAMVDELAIATEYGNIPLLKLGLQLRGINVGKALPPFAPELSPESRGRLADVMGGLREKLRI